MSEVESGPEASYEEGVTEGEREKPADDGWGRETAEESTPSVVRGEFPKPLSGPVVVLVSATLGFSFLLTELVWYRMLYPILGGTAYTLGIILCVVLPCLGIGRQLQGVELARKMPTAMRVATFLCVCALLLAVPYALGDHISVLSLFLRPLADVSFVALVAGWFLVTAFVVGPVSVAVGYLFPLFVTLIVLGGPDGAKKTAWAYVWNSLGSIAGALVGGLGLFTVVDIPSIWRWNVYGLLALAFLVMAPALKSEKRKSHIVGVGVVALAAILLSLVRGPTPAWRQSLASARMGRSLLRGPNEVQALLNRSRRGTVWSAEGPEHEAVVESHDGYAMYRHGRPAGDIWNSYASETMAALLGGLLVDDPRRTLLLGLGSGVGVDMLASLSSVREVHVVEPNPEVLNAVELFRPVNGDVLGHPKLRIYHRPALDALKRVEGELDLILGGTSDSFQGGDGGLNSLEFYQAAARKLRSDGAFFQTVPVQGTMSQALRSITTTLRAVFPSVEIWEVGWRRTLLLVARRQVKPYDIRQIRDRLSGPLYRSALYRAWGVTGVEGLFTGFLATSGFADTLHLLELDPVETLERPVLEFVAARNLGADDSLNVVALRELVESRGEAIPGFDRGSVEWGVTAELRSVRALEEMGRPRLDKRLGEGAQRRVKARQAYADGDLEAAWIYWNQQEEGPVYIRDFAMLAECSAVSGDNLALSYIRRLREEKPTEADAILTIWYALQERRDKAFDHALAMIKGLQFEGRNYRPILERTFAVILELARTDRMKSRDLYRALESPFAMYVLDDVRLRLRVELAFLVDIAELCAAALEPFEPDIPWHHRFLAQRYTCYSVVGHPLADNARSDLNQFEGRSTPGLERGLKPQSGL